MKIVLLNETSCSGGDSKSLNRSLVGLFSFDAWPFEGNCPLTKIAS